MKVYKDETFGNSYFNNCVKNTEDAIHVANEYRVWAFRRVYWQGQS